MTDSVELESIDAERVESYLRALQNNICQTLESLSESDRFFNLPIMLIPESKGSVCVGEFCLGLSET